MTVAGLNDKLRAGIRGVYAISIYRWLIGVTFLFAAHYSLPDHYWVIAFGLLVFNAAIESILLAGDLRRRAQSVIEDAAERKTRHTILHAAELAGRGAIDDYEFWRTVDRRVEIEREYDGDTAAGVWKSTGLVVGNVVYRIVGDLFGIGLVATISGA